MKKWLNGLGWTVCLLGLIGSFFLACYGGMQEYGNYYTYYDRNWGLTIGIFTGGFISTMIITFVLFALAEFLENQEKILKQQNDILTSIQSQIKMTDSQKQDETSEQNGISKQDETSNI